VLVRLDPQAGKAGDNVLGKTMGECHVGFLVDGVAARSAAVGFVGTAMKVMGGAFGSLAAGNPVKNDGAPNHDDSPHQAESGMLVQYVLGLPITAAIVGMKSLAELKANVAAARRQPLSEQQRTALEAQMIGAA
jgi:hypothetical protein